MSLSFLLRILLFLVYSERSSENHYIFIYYVIHNITKKHVIHLAYAEGLSWIGGNEIFRWSCLVFLNGMCTAQLSVPGTLLISVVWGLWLCLTFIPWHASMPWLSFARQSECWYYQRKSCFFLEVMGEWGIIYFRHRVHLCCTVHHSEEIP